MFLSVKNVGLTVLTGILSDLHQKIQDGVCLFGVSLFARLRNSFLSHNYSIVPLLVVNVVGAETNRIALFRVSAQAQQIMEMIIYSPQKALSSQTTETGSSSRLSSFI